MKSQKIVEYGKALQEVNDPTPTPQGAEVLVRISHCGVCHSDVHLHDGEFHLGGGKTLDVRAGRKLPFTLGHEIVGEVVAVGPAAEGVKVGDRRVVYPWIGCGTCPACQRDEEQLCAKPRQLGIQVDGGYSDHVLVPHGRYCLAFDPIPEHLAGTYTCSGLTAYAALKKLGHVGKADPVLIVGAGGVGMMGIQYAKAMFGTKPYVADIDAGKREAAMALGAAGAFDPSDANEVKRFIAETGGAYGAVDFVGADGSFGFASAAVRKGGRVVIVGLYGGSLQMPLVMFPMRAISVHGAYVGSLPEMKETLELARAGKVEAIPVEIRELAAASRSLDDLRAGRVKGRVVLKA